MSAFAYFGIFDPDGRPWDASAAGLRPYKAGLEASIKIAALTQEHLVLPVGYFFDNPALQKLVMERSGDADEARAFRAVARDVLRISLNESAEDPSAPAPTGIDWPGALDAWVRGTGSGRGQLVYLNSLPAPDAERLQATGDPVRFGQEMAAALLSLRRIDLADYLATLTALELRTVHQPPFEFDALLRERLLGRKETFRHLHEPLLDKLQAAAEATRDAGIRISRSLLNNPNMAREIGIPDAQVLSRAEYKAVAATLGHYHHMAFARALGAGAFTTFTLPTVGERASRLLERSFADLARPSSRAEAASKISWPVSRITFADIERLRRGKDQARFFDSLDGLGDAIAQGDPDAYRHALRSHARLVETSISLAFDAKSPSQIATEMARAAYSTATDPKTATKSAIRLMTHAKDLLPNAWKEVQLRMVFRAIEKQAVPANDARRTD
jgi:hypothetical protein